MIKHINPVKDPIGAALRTWYPEGHSLTKDSLHPVAKLAGEAGELLDLWGKDTFKPGFDWHKCKTCNDRDPEHYNHLYAPRVLDEAGDWSYYARILMWQADKKIEDFPMAWFPMAWFGYPQDKIIHLLNWINFYSASLLMEFLNHGNIDLEYLEKGWQHFNNFLILVESDLDQVLVLNYLKLNSDDRHHGWVNK